MKRFLLLLCALVPCACKPASDAATGPRSVARFVVQKTSGPVAEPWTEQYTVSRMGIEFRRAGEPGSAINAGAWAVPDLEGVPALFETLGSIDCHKFREVRPQDPPDGGGSISYLVEYQDGTTCSVWYREGITYSGAETLVEAVDRFVAGLTLPVEALSLYSSP